MDERVKYALEQSDHLFRKKGWVCQEILTARASRITRPAIQHIVASLDKSVHPRFVSGPALRHRRPGLIRKKPYGFEYRSLPFSDAVYQNIEPITESAFALLGDL